MKQSTNTNTNQSNNSKSVERVDAAAPSMLQSLRALQPKRLLSWTEAKAIAARQANRFWIANNNSDAWAFDVYAIAEQPKIRVSLDDQMTMAGSSHWTGSHWQILLNAHDHPSRRRFTLAHEYKHIIDHGRPVEPDLEERVCDHFAACLLMPKKKVIAAWTGGKVERKLVAMATAFAVSNQAMSYRLQELGLLERSSTRCGGVSSVKRTLSSETRPNNSEGIYYRHTPTRLARVA